jgi:hypothetical protein
MRTPSIIFVLLLSSASLIAQRSTSPTQYIAPPSSEGCPVVFSADRLSTPGLTQAQIDQKQGPQMRQMMAVQQQVAELEVKRSEAATKLAELPPGSDPATALQLGNQVKALDAELSAKRVELLRLNEAVASEALSNNAGNPVGQSVQITFSQSPSAIVGVDLTVHGVGMSARITPAAQSSRASELSETFHLSGSAAKPVLGSALSTQRPMIITWVELTRIEYANGASWQKSSTSRCAAAPGLYVLVGAGR